jgi:DNA-binding NarL/FixJ family response regulator
MLCGPMQVNGSAKAKIDVTAGAGSARIPIVLVEDHLILKEGLVALLEIEQDLEIVGQAADAATAIALVRSLRPAVLITDLSLEGESGISLIASVREVAPETASLVLTAHHEEEYFRAAMKAGALGFVLKDASRLELLDAIRSVAAGRQYLSSALASRVLSGYLRIAGEGSSVAPTNQLTDREREVLARIAAGQGNKAIASGLAISVKTVEKHRANLMRKLGLHNSAEVTMYAVKYGLIGTAGGQFRGW